MGPRWVSMAKRAGFMVKRGLRVSELGNDGAKELAGIPKGFRALPKDPTPTGIVMPDMQRPMLHPKGNTLAARGFCQLQISACKGVWGKPTGFGAEAGVESGGEG